jgi:hypothetical protein
LILEKILNIKVTANHDKENNSSIPIRILNMSQVRMFLENQLNGQAMLLVHGHYQHLHFRFSLGLILLLVVQYIIISVSKITDMNLILLLNYFFRNYLEKFKDEYPKNRKAVIPFIL